MKLSRLPVLDGLRALAALMVMFFHFTGHHGEPGWLRQLAVLGQTGVDLFFVLSGFLITRILLATREAPHFFRTFYTRRALRIFPLYYGYLVFHYFVQPLCFHYPVPAWEKQWWFWFYLQNIPAIFPGHSISGPGHFWSLAIEEHFYLFWPLAVWALSRRGFTWFAVGTIILAPVLRAIFLARGWQVFYFTFTRMDALAYGGVLALLYTSTRLDQWKPWLRRAAIGLPLLLAPAFIFLSGSQAIWLQVVKLGLIPAAYAALMGWLLTDEKLQPLSRVLSGGPAGWVGGISYGLYVFHPFAFELSREVLGLRQYVPDLLVGFGLSFTLAWLSYRFFESRILEWKSRFEYERGASP